MNIRLIILSVLLMAYGNLRGQIAFDKQSFSFGKIYEAQNKIHKCSFTLKNNGNKAKAITRITTTCGCTATEYNKAPILPGEEREVKVSFNPAGQRGKFRKAIVFYVTDEEKPYKVYVDGEVIPNANIKVEGYPYSFGELQLRTIHNTFKGMKNRTVARSIPVINPTNKKISVRIKSQIANIYPDKETLEFPPNQKGNIRILYKSNNNNSIKIKLEEAGKTDDTINLIIVKE